MVWISVFIWVRNRRFLTPIGASRHEIKIILLNFDKIWHFRVIWVCHLWSERPSGSVHGICEDPDVMQILMLRRPHFKGMEN